MTLSLVINIWRNKKLNTDVIVVKAKVVFHADAAAQQENLRLMDCLQKSKLVQNAMVVDM